MNEIKGDIINFINKPKTIVCITTNGFVKANGYAVMGAGCAYDYKQRYPEAEKILGGKLSENGVRVEKLRMGVLAFPVKWKWWEKADIELIKASCRQLNSIIKRYSDSIDAVILPKPGCGNGKLKWSSVEKEISDILVDKRIWIISKE